MSLNDIPLVDFPLKGSCFFVLFVLIEGPSKKWFLYGRKLPTYGLIFKQFLADAMNDGVAMNNFKCRGCGNIIIDTKTKEVRVEHAEKDMREFGKYDALIVKILLSPHVEKYLKGFTLIVKAV